MDNTKYRIVEYKRGKFGYKSWFEFQYYNDIYKGWYALKSAILLEFIESHCIINRIDFKSIPHEIIE